ncbi:MAG: leucine-rich repeat domain-containing protein [Eubacterium sp.]|nr:leucine-rich repeat domain-containing protein [Eubacterium sp.]
MKRILSLILSVLMLTSCLVSFGTQAYAKTTKEKVNGVSYTYKIEDGKAIITYVNYDDFEALEDETYTIPYKLGGKTVKEIRFKKNKVPHPWNENIKTVKIGRYLRYINDNFFASCTNLKKIIVNSKNKSFKVKSGVLFCTYNKKKTLVCYPSAKSEKSYSIPKNVKIIGASAFCHNKNLRSIKVPKGVTTIKRSAFEHTKVTSFTLPKSVTTIENCAFMDCYKMKKLDLSKTKIKKISGGLCSSCMYDEESYLNSVKLPSTVTKVEGFAFAGQSALKTFTFPSSVKNIGENVFWICDNLKKVTVKNPKAKIHKNAFADLKITLCAKKNSTAHKYAKSHKDIKFKAL